MKDEKNIQDLSSFALSIARIIDRLPIDKTYNIRLSKPDMRGAPWEITITEEFMVENRKIFKEKISSTHINQDI